MASRHVCSNPECNSKRFVTPSHVVEDWLVDEFGNYIEVVETTETTHGPDDDNTWTCAECGAQAVVATGDEPDGKLPRNLRLYEDVLGCEVEFWSNNAGDLFDNERDLEESELPPELKRAYKLYTEGCWTDEYICKLDGKPGIVMLTHYDGDYAVEIGLAPAVLLERVEDLAVWYARKFDTAQVVFGKNALRWKAGMIGKEYRESILMLWLPWDTPFEQFSRVEKVFAETCLNLEDIPDIEASPERGC